ncbi:MAG: hypothetical protein Q4B15_05575 [Lachnospiraceae bacterium]|nr:hypothetical protein [Lachnospiraceae bacterium]
MNKLERKFGKYAVPHLTAVLIGCYIIGYMLQLMNRNIVSFMRLEPALILQGQIWRLITWIIIPPSSLSIWTFIMLFFYFSIGTSLERVWGDFRYNVYILGGMLITILSAFVCYFIFGSSIAMGTAFSTYYICMSIMLAYAATFPDAQVLIYFVFPVKMRWIGWIYGALLAYDIVNYIRAVMQGFTFAWIYVIAILASLANFVIFFFLNKKKNHVHLNHAQRTARKQFRQASESTRPFGSTEAANQGRVVPRHRCEICGRTDVSNPELEFRYCSKCNGAHEYCSDHLFTHIHVQ